MTTKAFKLSVRGGTFSRDRSFRAIGISALCALVLSMYSCADIGLKRVEETTEASSVAVTTDAVTTEKATETSAAETTAQVTSEVATEAPTEVVTEAPTQPATEYVTEVVETTEMTEEPEVVDTPAVTEAPEVPPAVTSGTTSRGYTIATSNGVTSIDGVIIANKTYSLPASYDPGDLTPETWTAFSQMQQAASAEGLFLYSCSGYRSYDTQSWLYQSYVYRDGQALADTYSARPGYSEHQTGLAIDINNTLASFAYSAEGIWLAEHCHEFGFIIRYPAGKEAITGYCYEPWHVRYVGKELAAKLTATGETLEEYFGIDSVYR